VIPGALSGLADVVSLVTALAGAEKAVAGSVQQIADWVTGGPVPDPLPPLPDLVRGDLELAAMRARAARDEAARQG
jgi:hypothetical protein